MLDRKKIVIIANNLTGLYLFRGMMIRVLLQKGVSIVALVPSGTYKKELEDMNVRIIDTPVDRRGINLIKDSKLIWKYYKIIKEEKPDCIITYTIKPNIYGGLVGRFIGKEYYTNITGLGTAFEDNGLLQIIVKKLYKMALKSARTVFFENSGDCKIFIDNKIVKESICKVLNGAGVDTEKFFYMEYPRNDTFKFLFIGRVMKEKGVNELFQAVQLLRRNNTMCELHILGSYEENYREYIEKTENKEWLFYHGFQKDIRPFIAECDCFVLPSYHEGMANTNLECASAGRPIITSNIPGCKEAVVDGSGLLCEPKNVNSLFVVMKEMTEKSWEEREQMGKVGRKHMEDVFDKEKVVAETVKYLL